MTRDRLVCVHAAQLGKQLHQVFDDTVTAEWMDIEQADPSALPPAEAALLSERAVHKRRQEFAAGRELARTALAQAGGPADFELLRDEQGAPVWPEGWAGSLTHSGGVAAVVLARVGPHVQALGCDVERSEPLRHELWRLVCTPGDEQMLQQWPEAEREGWGKVLFSAKEATYKAQYALSGQVFGFQGLDIELDSKTGSFLARFNLDAPPFSRGSVCSGRFARDQDLIVTGLQIGSA